MFFYYYSYGYKNYERFWRLQTLCLHVQIRSQNRFHYSPMFFFNVNKTTKINSLPCQRFVLFYSLLLIHNSMCYYISWWRHWGNALLKYYSSLLKFLKKLRLNKSTIPKRVRLCWCNTVLNLGSSSFKSKHWYHAKLMAAF